MDRNNLLQAKHDLLKLADILRQAEDTLSNLVGVFEELVEPGECLVRLLDMGMNKISVIKIVRTYTGCGLKEAKDIVERAPVNVIPTDISMTREMAREFELVEAKVKLHGGDCDKCQHRFKCYTGEVTRQGEV